MLIRFVALFCLLAGIARAEPPRVVADIAPVHGLVARVMDGVGAPALLMRPGADPHHYALRPSEAAALEGADLVVWIGPGLTPWLSGPLESLARGAGRLALLEADGTHLLQSRDSTVFADTRADRHDDGHEHDDDREHGHEHEREANDPHAWLDPENGKSWLDAIAARLSALDPANAEIYAANAAAGRAEIEAANQAIADALAPLRGRDILVAHDAFQYFEARFGLMVISALSLSDAVWPGPARLAAIRDAVQGRDIACVLADPGAPRGAVSAVLGRSSVPVARADPLGAGLSPGAAFYPALLGEIAEALETCADLGR